MAAFHSERKIQCMYVFLAHSVLYALPTAELHPPMIDIMEASRGLPVRPALVYFPTDTERLHKAVKQLPHAMKFVKATTSQMYCEFNDHYRGAYGICGQSSVAHGLLRTKERIVLLTFLSHARERTKIEIANRIYVEVRYRWVIDTNLLSELFQDFGYPLSQLVSVSRNDISVSEDRYRRCEMNRTISASELFSLKMADIRRFPTGQKLRCMLGILGRVHADVTKMSEALALIQVYRSLNNTLDIEQLGHWRDFKLKNIDIVILPSGSSILLSGHVFPYAQYSPVLLCFFNRRRVKNTISLWTPGFQAPTYCSP